MYKFVGRPGSYRLSLQSFAADPAAHILQLFDRRFVPILRALDQRTGVLLADAEDLCDHGAAPATTPAPTTAAASAAAAATPAAATAAPPATFTVLALSAAAPAAALTAAAFIATSTATPTATAPTSAAATAAPAASAPSPLPVPAAPCRAIHGIGVYRVRVPSDLAADHCSQQR